VTGLLNAMATRSGPLPKGVVLDMWISKDEPGLTGLQEAVRRLQASHVKVYAAVDPMMEGAPGQLDPDYMERHALRLYDLLDGKGHTLFDHRHEVAKYDPELVIPMTSGSEHLQALPVKIATDFYDRSLTAAGDPIIVNMGEPKELRTRTYTFQLGEGGSPTFTQYQPGGGASGQTAEPDFGSKLVIVASLEKDRPGIRELSRAEVLAFAISERILPSDSARRPELLATPVLLLALVALFAALAAALFWLLFRKWARFRSRLWLLALASAGACLLGLALWVTGMSMLNRVYPQVTLVGIGILLSTVLSWRYTQRGLELRLITPPTDKPEAGREELPSYDVFISYGRTPENLAWVKENVYEWLLKERKADGTPLRIFFDQRSIEPGEDWFAKLALAIEGSRFFLPVYTSDYFSRRFCQFEMQRAAPRHVVLGDFIVAIAREAIKIPTQYDHIQCLDVQTDPHFMNRVVDRIRKREQVSPGG
jgi:hypothetical protein